MFVLSMNASMPSVTSMSQIVDLSCHGVASDWYAVIREWEIRAHLIAALLYLDQHHTMGVVQSAGCIDLIPRRSVWGSTWCFDVLGHRA